VSGNLPAGGIITAVFIGGQTTTQMRTDTLWLLLSASY